MRFRIGLVTLLLIASLFIIPKCTYADNIELLGRTLNSFKDARDIVIVDTLAYVAFLEGGIIVYDISDPENISQTGYWDSRDPCMAIAAGEDENYLYVLLPNGMHVLNIENLDNIVSVCFLEGEHYDNWNFHNLKMSVQENLLFRRYEVLNFDIVNISNPEQPEVIWENPRYSMVDDFSISDTLMYLLYSDSLGTGLRIFDISNPEQPDSISLTEWYSFWGDLLSVTGNYAYVAMNRFDHDECDTLAVINVSDPFSPSVVGYETIPSSRDNGGEMTIDENYLYLANGKQFLIVDITERAEPVLVQDWNYQFLGSAISVDVQDNIAIVGGRSIEALDVRDPENIEELSVIQSEIIRDVEAYGQYAVVLSSLSYNHRNNFLHVIDVNDPNDPIEVSRLEIHCYYAKDLQVYDSHAYIIGDDEHELCIVNFNDPENPELVEIIDLHGTRAHEIIIKDDLAYVSVTSDTWELLILDLAVPSRPNLLRASDEFDFTGNLNINDDRLYASVRFLNTYQTAVFDISNAPNINSINIYPISGSSACVRDSLLIIEKGSGEKGEFRIYNISSPDDPTLLSHIGNDIDNIFVRDSVAIVGGEDLRVFNISDPRDPGEVGNYIDAGYAYDIEVTEDGLIYVADGTNFGIYRFTHPVSVDEQEPVVYDFSLSPAYPNPFNSSTTINFTLPHSSDAVLSVFDMSGRLVETLTNDYLQAGQHSVVWNGMNSASGIYFVRLDSGELQSTQKIVLVK